MNPTAAGDLERVNPQFRRLQDPYSGGEVVTVPALQPDVAIVHGQRADPEGNCHLWGILGEQREAAFAARRVILTVEDIVDPAVIRSDPNRTLIPGLVVTAVCHVPHCAHPSYTQGYYDRDNSFYLEWDRISADPAQVAGWLDRWVYGVKDRAEYWDQLGPAVHERLKVAPLWSEPVNYGKH
jgi:glutaconate CoA-transferase subunit A